MKTFLEKFSPSGLIFSFVDIIYLESGDTSPIFIQLIPVSSFVK